ncbi:MAG: ZIP family metal transporter, partial [Flavobacteriaceae bacterium]
MYFLNYFLPLFGALLGMGAAFIVKPKSPRGLKLILSFSGAFLLGITIFHLLPSVFTAQNNKVGIGIVIGLILQ